MYIDLSFFKTCIWCSKLLTSPIVLETVMDGLNKLKKLKLTVQYASTG
jgi:hypothetical protein